MVKSKLITWGVSFGSMTLVAGIVAFLGYTNGQSLTQNQSTTASSGQYNQEESTQEQWGSEQPSQGPYNQGENNSSLFKHDRSGSFRSNSNQNESQFQSPFGEQQEQFDTKTGGTSF